MAIKPVTFQASKNFNSNLYALEVKSRFGNQSEANGYYTGYGNELDAVVVGNTITIKKGAFLIAGRMAEITTDQEITISPMTHGLVGYVVARAETFHTDDEENVSLTFYLASSLDSIVLTQEDTYANISETENKIYEIPLYSFKIDSGAITNLVKVIKPIQEISEMMSKVTQSAQSAQQAQELATMAQESASEAQESASEALRLVEQAVFEGGTVVTRDGAPLGTLEIKPMEEDVATLKDCYSMVNIPINENNRSETVSLDTLGIQKNNLLVAVLVKIRQVNQYTDNTIYYNALLQIPKFMEISVNREDSHCLVAYDSYYRCVAQFNHIDGDISVVITNVATGNTVTAEIEKATIIAKW